MVVNFMHYPVCYNNGSTQWGFYHNFYSVALSKGNEFIVSFPMDDKIYLYSLDGHLKKEFIAKSDFFSGSQQSYEQSKEFKSYYVKENAYGNIYYDKYRDVYYRYAFQRAENNKQDVMPIDPATFKPATIIILDKNFSKIGETELPKNKHYYFNSFVGKKGFYISNHHPYNKQVNENELSYTCYKLTTK